MHPRAEDPWARVRVAARPWASRQYLIVCCANVHHVIPMVRHLLPAGELSGRVGGPSQLLPQVLPPNRQTRVMYATAAGRVARRHRSFGRKMLVVVRWCPRCREASACCDKKGVDRKGLDRKGVDRKGVDRNGHDRKGVDRTGVDRKGHDRKGVDRKGVDRKGHDRKGVDTKGVDRNGHDSRLCGSES